jgi:MFS transporter, Spinster family, sphingosine-1-phosphate transporter
MTFTPDKRSRILGWFNLGMPIGGAIGVMAGGAIGVQFGWQWAFGIVGVPGLILAYFTWKLRVDKKQATEDTQGAQSRFDWRIARGLFKNPAYIYTCLGYAGISYSFGAIVTFAPLYFHRDFGYTVAQAGLITGVLQVVAGLFGAPVGGYIADAWMKRNPRGRAYTVMLAMSLSAVCLFVGIDEHSLPFLFLSTFFMLWHVGVASSITFDVTDRRVWNTAQGLSLLVMHGLGDVPSNYITGLISDHTNLAFSFSLLPIPMLLATLFFYLVSTRIPRIVSVDSHPSIS